MRLAHAQVMSGLASAVEEITHAKNILLSECFFNGSTDFTTFLVMVF
jgi:hypothetical protein